MSLLQKLKVSWHINRAYSICANYDFRSSNRPWEDETRNFNPVEKHLALAGGHAGDDRALRRKVFNVYLRVADTASCTAKQADSFLQQALFLSRLKGEMSEIIDDELSAISGSNSAGVVTHRAKRLLALTTESHVYRLSTMDRLVDIALQFPDFYKLRSGLVKSVLNTAEDTLEAASIIIRNPALPRVFAETDYGTAMKYFKTFKAAQPSCQLTRQAANQLCTALLDQPLNMADAADLPLLMAHGMEQIVGAPKLAAKFVVACLKALPDVLKQENSAGATLLFNTAAQLSQMPLAPTQELASRELYVSPERTSPPGNRIMVTNIGLGSEPQLLVADGPGPVLEWDEIAYNLARSRKSQDEVISLIDAAAGAHESLNQGKPLLEVWTGLCEKNLATPPAVLLKLRDAISKPPVAA